MKRRSIHLRHLIMSALFSAMILITTRYFQFPIPATGGYIHPGDALCLLAAWLLPLPYGMAAAALGTMLADLLGGYAIYAIPSFIIKLLVVLAAKSVFCLLYRGTPSFKRTLAPCLISGFAGEFFMVMGYFFFSAVVRGGGIEAAISIPSDSLQGAFGIVCATMLFYPLSSRLIPRLQRLL
jgi:uncharacterized membrane protein